MIVGIMITTSRASDAIKLLLAVQVAENYASIEDSYRTGNAEIFVWEIKKFNSLLDKVKEYNVVPDTEFTFYKFISMALLLRFSSKDDPDTQRYETEMYHNFDLFSKTRNKPMDKREIIPFIDKVIESWEKAK